MNNSAATYKITFSGKTLNNTSEKLVAQRFARVFKLEDKIILNKIFSGATITIKRGLKHGQADRYREVLTKLGADCCIEPDQHGFTGNNQELDREYERKKRRKLAELYRGNVKEAALTPK